MSPSTIHNVRRMYKIASIPADGIGPEVISAGIQVLNKLVAVLGQFQFRFDHFDWSSDVYKRTGKYIPDDGLEALKKYDAILFGAVGDRGPYFPTSSTRAILTVNRRPRSYLVVEPPIGNLSALPAIRQLTADPCTSRHFISSTQLPAWQP